MKHDHYFKGSLVTVVILCRIVTWETPRKIPKSFPGVVHLCQPPHLEAAFRSGFTHESSVPEAL